MFTKKFFDDLELKLRAVGLDSDAESFDTIKERLLYYKPLSSYDFASQAIYVILAGGFSQKTAKMIHQKIMNYLASGSLSLEELLSIFKNKNKINAIIKIWGNRDIYRDKYYEINDLDAKLNYLYSLPHIGKITANHLARNLGENVVKYDIWIQRLGVTFVGGGEKLKSKINNGRLNPEIKIACDKMFAHLERETNLPRGYIDVVLWKACQNRIIAF